MKNKKTKQSSKESLLLLKWILLIAACLILGGILSFALILMTANLLNNDQYINPIWIIGMIPLMAIVAFPVTFLIYKQVTKNVTVLVRSMAKVAGGDLDTYIPTAEAKDFKEVFENFNKMVAEIQSLEAVRTTMFDNLSHELKTPIASIGGFAKILDEKELPDEKKRQYLKIIMTESDKLDKLVKSILLLSKLNAQEIVTKKEPYNLTEQLQDCVIALEHDWTAKNIDVSAELDEVTYNGDKQLVNSLWTNLISNAIKYTPNDGAVTLSLTTTEDRIVAKISDTGIGMSTETIKHIFDPHYQADSSLSSGGQGLGLSIAKRIVKLIGGSIAVFSKKNEGSTFVVELPK